jgi:hypothetical protein
MNGRLYAKDLVIKNGFVNSMIYTEFSAKPFIISGYGPSVGLDFVQSPKTSLGFMLEPMFNVVAAEISRMSFTGYANYSLLGRNRRITWQAGDASITQYNAHALYFSFRTSIANYQTHIPKTKDVITGSNFQILGGIGARYDIGQTQSLGLELVSTAFSLVNGQSAIRVKEYQAGLIWQVDI